MIQSYQKQIEDLVTENQILKENNYKLQIQCASLIQDIVELFAQYFQSIPPYDQQNMENAINEIAVYYRRNLLAAKERINKQIYNMLTNTQQQKNKQVQQFGSWLDPILKIVIQSHKNQQSKLVLLHEQISQCNDNEALLEAKISQLQLGTEKLNQELFDKVDQIKELKDKFKSCEIEKKSSQGKLMRRNNQYELLEEQFRQLKQETEFLNVTIRKLQKRQ